MEMGHQSPPLSVIVTIHEAGSGIQGGLWDKIFLVPDLGIGLIWSYSIQTSLDGMAKANSPLKIIKSSYVANRRE
jgi:hypothetical protein